jgi:hypothetical protein
MDTWNTTKLSDDVVCGYGVGVGDAENVGRVRS